MTVPPWRVDNFLPEFSNWRAASDPSKVWRNLVLARITDLETAGLTQDAVYLDADPEGFEALEPIHGTTVSISCLVFPRAGRIVIIDIRS